ncbi:MAG: hypothetical protein RIR70_364 [Pseudomonadota bacterium]|jgi:4-amino-4-deoxy-L-arabinose transferase-like glycosyltransferase
MASAETASLGRLLWVLLLATLGFRMWFAHALPFTGDEAYFYYWGAVPDWGFYDHPPMVGWWLAALQAVSHDTLWLRLPSVILPAVMALSVWRFLQPYGQDVSRTAAVLVLLAPANVWNVAITTDTPLVFFSFFSALCFLRAVRDDAPLWYLACGAFLGGAFLSKYFSVLLGVAFAVALFWRGSAAKRLGLCLIVLAAAPAVVLNVWWNMGHCWANIMFNVFNRHGDAGWSWKTPLLYAATVLYLLTPPVVWAVARGGLSERLGGQGFFIAAIAGVPLAIFAVLSVVKTIGMHWLLSFVPFALMAVVLCSDQPRRAWLQRFFLGFAALHVILIGVIASLPVETWRKTRLYDGIILTVKSDELLAKLSPYSADHVFMTDGYSPSVTLSFNAQRYFPVFGDASSHARHDDILTDFRPLDGRNLLVLTKSAPDLARYTPYFATTEVKPIEVRGAQFWLVLGQGFQYRVYRDAVLERARERWYAVPRWLPQTGCYFCERYFPERACTAP